MDLCVVSAKRKSASFRVHSVLGRCGSCPARRKLSQSRCAPGERYTTVVDSRCPMRLCSEMACVGRATRERLFLANPSVALGERCKTVIQDA